MLLRKNLFILVISSIFVYSGCTKDEEAIDSPMGTGSESYEDGMSGSGAMQEEFSPVYFGFDQFTVKTEYSEEIRSVASALNSGNAYVQIDGHCDSRATTEYNLVLGAKRAEAVKSTLMGMGVDESRIVTNSFGKEKLAVEGNTESAHSKNRRAEFTIIK